METNIMGIAGVAAITVICLLVGQIVKASGIDNKWIPCICGVLGGCLGALALYIRMDGFVANDYMTAVAIGIVSGLAATGANQVAKQLNQVEGEL